MPEVRLIGDLATAEVLDTLRLPGCPLCSLIAAHERRYIQAFWPAARMDPYVRERFWAAGGFCPWHAQLFQHHVAARTCGPAVADLYRRLAERDLPALDERLSSLEGRRHRARRQRWPARQGRCPACEDRDRALARKAAFLVLALDDEDSWRLAGRLLNATFGWWWADIAAGAILVADGIREGAAHLHATRQTTTAPGRPQAAPPCPQAAFARARSPAPIRLTASLTRS